VTTDRARLVRHPQQLHQLDVIASLDLHEMCPHKHVLKLKVLNVNCKENRLCQDISEDY
jgi:hypothetical protein